MHRSRFIASALALCLCALVQTASGQLRIVTMNASNADPASNPSPSIYAPRTGMGTILSGIGSMVSDDPTLVGSTGIAKPVDVLCLQEVTSASTTCAAYASLLNTLYNTNTYSWGTLNGNSSGSG